MKVNEMNRKEVVNAKGVKQWTKIKNIDRSSNFLNESNLKRS